MKSLMVPPECRNGNVDLELTTLHQSDGSRRTAVGRVFWHLSWALHYRQTIPHDDDAGRRVQRATTAGITGHCATRARRLTDERRTALHDYVMLEIFEREQIGGACADAVTTRRAAIHVDDGEQLVVEV
jgi:hypothetical protein